MKLKKEFLKGIATATIVFAGIVTAQVLIINNVPYTYRTSGFRNLAAYILTTPMLPISKEARMAIPRILKADLL